MLNTRLRDVFTDIGSVIKQLKGDYQALSTKVDDAITNKSGGGSSDLKYINKFPMISSNKENSWLYKLYSMNETVTSTVDQEFLNSVEPLYTTTILDSTELDLNPVKEVALQYNEVKIGVLRTVFTKNDEYTSHVLVEGIDYYEVYLNDKLYRKGTEGFDLDLSGVQETVASLTIFVRFSPYTVDPRFLLDTAISTKVSMFKLSEGIHDNTSVVAGTSYGLRPAKKYYIAPSDNTNAQAKEFTTFEQFKAAVDSFGVRSHNPNRLSMSGDSTPVYGHREMSYSFVLSSYPIDNDVRQYAATNNALHQSSMTAVDAYSRVLTTFNKHSVYTWTLPADFRDMTGRQIAASGG